jgi:hypothetical protein
VEDEPSAPTERNQSDADGKWISIEQNRTAAPEQSEESDSRVKSILHWICRCPKYVIEKLDKYDGAVTASATIVIAVLTWAIAHDGRKQMEAIQGQLSEMGKQRLAVIAQTRANPLRDFSVHAVTTGRKLAEIGEPIIGYEFSPYWDNRGATEARSFRGWFNLNVFDIDPTRPRNLSGKDCPALATPDPLPEERIIMNGRVAVLLAQFLSISDAQAEIGDTASKFVLMWGHAEWTDIYFPETPSHSDDWCVSVVPNNLQGQTFSYISMMDRIR